MEARRRRARRGVVGHQMRKIVSSITRRLFPPSQTIEGYEHSELVDVIFRKTLAYRTDGEWREMAGSSSVLDFGGGCGLHYKQAWDPSTVRWAIVETPAMVARATELATDRLRFFTSILHRGRRGLARLNRRHAFKRCADKTRDNPYSILQQLCALRSKRMLWYRVFLSPDIEKKQLQSSLLGDNDPDRSRSLRKNVRYVRTAISEQAFLDAHESYKLKSADRIYSLQRYVGRYGIVGCTVRCGCPLVLLYVAPLAVGLLLTGEWTPSRLNTVYPGAPAFKLVSGKSAARRDAGGACASVRCFATDLPSSFSRYHKTARPPPGELTEAA